MDQRLAQVLGARFVILTARTDLVGVPVVLQRGGVFDGEVGESLVVVAGGVAALGDQAGDQLVRGLHRLLRTVHEPDLDLFPGGRVLRPGFGGERLQFQLRVPLGAFVQLTLGLGAVAGVGDDAVVLGTEGLLQLAAPHGLDPERDRAEHQQDDDDQDDGGGGGHQVPPSSVGGIPTRTRSSIPFWKTGRVTVRSPIVFPGLGIRRGVRKRTVATPTLGKWRSTPISRGQT